MTYRQVAWLRFPRKAGVVKISRAVAAKWHGRERVW